MARIHEDPSRTFSAADYLLPSVDAEWEHWKELGNHCLAKSEYLAAAEYYRKAANISVGPIEAGLASAFVQALRAWPMKSVHRRLSETNNVLERIHWFLRSPLMKLKSKLFNGKDNASDLPNKAAGIAWGNCAAALLAAGKHDEALQAARNSVRYCPEYVKGHHRQMKALEACGRLIEAQTKRKEIEEYEELYRVKKYTARYIGLLKVGWITWEQADQIYAPLLRQRVVAHIAARLGPPSLFGENRRVFLKASVVPFMGGQGLILCLDACDTCGVAVSYDFWNFCMLDPEVSCS